MRAGVCWWAPQVMCSAGSVCVFHVGGGVDEVTDPTLPEVPRWEFFIGDR